jgi:hypothetical protein
MRSFADGFRDIGMDIIARIMKRQYALRRATRHVLTSSLTLTVKFSKLYYTR